MKNRQTIGLYILITSFLLLFSSVQGSDRNLADCTPLETIFTRAGAILYESSVNSETIGGDKGDKGDHGSNESNLVAGALKIWSNNPLTAGSGDYEEVGLSSGRCTLLPRLENWFCYGVLKFESSTITYAGISPNSEEKGTLVITGGTGCYQDATGSLTLTPLFIEEYSVFSWDFSWEYIPPIHSGNSGNANIDTNRGPQSSQSSQSSQCPTLKELINTGLIEVPSGNEVVTSNSGLDGISGSMNLWNSNPLVSYALNVDNDEQVVGQSYGECTFLPGGVKSICIGMFSLWDENYVTFVGHTNGITGIGTYAITGGAGCYSNANGTLTVEGTDPENSSYRWKYYDPPSTCDASLLELFGSEPVIYEKINTAEMIGDDNTAGSLYMWSDNSLYSGDLDCPIADSVTIGHCIVMPNSKERLCMSQFILDGNPGGNTVVNFGASPTTTASAFISVIGGTGCFPGIKGVWEVTPEEDNNLIVNKLISTNLQVLGLDSGGNDSGICAGDEMEDETLAVETNESSDEPDSSPLFGDELLFDDEYDSIEPDSGPSIGDELLFDDEYNTNIESDLSSEGEIESDSASDEAVETESVSASGNADVSDQSVDDTYEVEDSLSEMGGTDSDEGGDVPREREEGSSSNGNAATAPGSVATNQDISLILILSTAITSFLLC